MTYPHCDPDVLHAPGECVYCDKRSDLQQNRIVNGINFTGHGIDPATRKRPLELINRWSGNVAKTQKTIEKEEKEWQEFYRRCARSHYENLPNEYGDPQ